MKRNGYGDMTFQQTQASLTIISIPGFLKSNLQMDLLYIHNGIEVIRLRALAYNWLLLHRDLPWYFLVAH